MDEEKVVQAEEVSKEETTSTEAETTETEQTQEQPFTEAQEAKMQQMMAEATSQAREEGKREMQGIKDREVADAQRRAARAESRATASDASFKGLDEETQKDIETARLRGEVQYYQTFEQQEEAKRQQDAYFQQLDQSLKEEVGSLGIEPDDNRIDWAKDAPDYFTGRKRFSASLAKIQKENVKVTEESLEKRLLAKIEAQNLKNRIDAGLESHDTTISEGGEGGGNPDKIIEAYGDGKVSREEYEKAMKQKGLSP